MKIFTVITLISRLCVNFSLFQKDLLYDQNYRWYNINILLLLILDELIQPCGWITLSGECLTLYSGHESRLPWCDTEILLDLLSPDMFSGSSISDAMRRSHWLKEARVSRCYRRPLVGRGSRHVTLAVVFGFIKGDGKGNTSGPDL